MERVAILMDGGHVRALAKRARKAFEAQFLLDLGLACRTDAESVRRILFYDCSPFQGTVTLPVSGDRMEFTGSDRVLRELAQLDHVAVRRGVLKFRGWLPKRVPIAGRELTDGDFRPEFEQKGVDMRIGLDIANYAANRSVDRVVLVTNDTDCVPAMKYARRAGLQIILACLPDYTPAPELIAHCDIRRNVRWP